MDTVSALENQIFQLEQLRAEGKKVDSMLAQTAQRLQEALEAEQHERDESHVSIKKRCGRGEA